jgi:hypothetical protein
MLAPSFYLLSFVFFVSLDLLMQFARRAYMNFSEFLLGACPFGELFCTLRCALLIAPMLFGVLILSLKFHSTNKP